MRNRKTFFVASVLVLSALPGVCSAERVGGPAADVSAVGTNSTSTCDIGFRGGHRAEIVIVGDGETDLDFFVLDSRGRLVALDTNRTDVCTPWLWVPRKDTYRVVIKNRCSAYNEFEITTN